MFCQVRDSAGEIDEAVLHFSGRVVGQADLLVPADSRMVCRIGESNCVVRDACFERAGHFGGANRPLRGVGDHHVNVAARRCPRPGLKGAPPLGALAVVDQVVVNGNQVDVAVGLRFAACEGPEQQDRADTGTNNLVGRTSSVCNGRRAHTSRLPTGIDQGSTVCERQRRQRQAGAGVDGALACGLRHTGAPPDHCDASSHATQFRSWRLTSFSGRL